ncbi:MAG: hypothetical protein H7Z14_17990 [Anaerolineae bacterium]|nr:hypothetical protein [Phycisphaerae bacterium]
MASRSNILRVAPQYQPLVREVGLDAEAVFDHEQIRAWRKLTDRENCTLDFTDAKGDSHRWHIKRYPAPMLGLHSPAELEVEGYRALHSRDIPTASLVGWGQLSDRRSFVISEDLNGYEASDKLLADGGSTFDRLLEPTAQLAAKLHGAGLHHRDLYLCHFFSRVDEGAIDVKLIDVARVRPLRSPLTRRRWIVKDLAQFWFSTLEHSSITDDARNAWLAAYASRRGINGQSLRTAIQRKSDSIARHDRKLRELQPNRNISIPTE